MEWKEIKNHPNYMVSKNGQIKNIKNDKVLNCNCNTKNSYRKVNIDKINIYIHRVVAETFIPNPNNYKYVNHKDEDKLNNNVENLEWCTQKYNCNYGTRNKKISESISKSEYKNNVKKYYKEVYKKENHWAYGTKNKTSNKSVICITTGIIYKSLTEASEDTRVAYQNISACCRGKLEKAGKDSNNNWLVWKYYN